MTWVAGSMLLRQLQRRRLSGPGRPGRQGSRDASQPLAASVRPRPIRISESVRNRRGAGHRDLEFAVCGLAQCPVEQALIAKAMAQLMLEAANGVKILRSSRVLVRG